MRTRLLIGVVVLILVGVVVGVVLLGDDGGDSPNGETSASTSTTSAPGTAPDDPVVTEAIVPTSEAPPEATRSAEEVVGAAAPDLALTDDQLACLTNRLATEPELLESVGDDPQRGSEGFGVLVEEGQRCVALLDLAPAFIDGITPSLTTEPTEEQRECLALAYADLPDEDLQAIVNAGLEPDGEEAEAGRATLDALLGQCDLARR